MKIAAIFFYLNTSSGSANSFLSTVHGLKALGHEVDVYTYYFDPKKCFPKLLAGLNISYIKKTNNQENLSVTTVKSRVLAAVDYFINAKKIYPKLIQKNYDAIFCSESCSYISALEYKKTKNIPVVLSLFDPITLIDNNKPSSLVRKYWWFKELLKLYAQYDKKLIRQLDLLFIPTQKLKTRIDTFYEIDSLVFPTAGINRNDFTSDHTQLALARLKKLGYKDNKTLLFSHAHFQPHRRYEDTIQALHKLVKKYPDLCLVISGSEKFDKQYYTSILQLIETLDLQEHVIIDTGYKTAEELSGYYQLCDIFIFVCIEQTWGLAPFEAMACKKPVIITSSVGCSEVLDETSALIIPPKNPNKIIETVEMLLINNSLKKNISKNGYALTMDTFTYDKIAQRLNDLLLKII